MSGEDDLIARLFAPLAGPAGLGLKDDAALMAVPAGFELVVTKDALVAGRHFLPADPPASVAAKALGVNLSDLAAKAAAPFGFLLAIALPPGLDGAWLDDFAAGLGAVAAAAGCPLAGGDTVSTPGPLVLSITALGLVPAGRMLPRTGARPGDRLYVSGTVGDAALGLFVRLAETGAAALPAGLAAVAPADRAHLADRYLRPQPRLALRAALAHANGGMDVSDGLVGDAAKMLRASGVTGRLHAGCVPLSPAARAAVAAEPALLEAALTGGDDYEVLASVPAAGCAAFERAAAAAGVPVTAIGRVEAGHAPMEVLDGRGAPLGFARGSFSHF